MLVVMLVMCFVLVMCRAVCRISMDVLVALWGGRHLCFYTEVCSVCPALWLWGWGCLMMV